GALTSVCGPGSVLAMDCWRRVGGRSVYDQLRRLGERAIRLIGGAGFDVLDLATAGEMTRRYATAGRHCDEGMYVVAGRLR
ncbi:MAG: S-adenosyl-L-methionine-dependent methyltransferase, partial [Jatrophihabitans sp.]|nr:S-adenosyl-L-methionine-dependent methyltransferase [Jatrophihabitans sp.]